MSEPVFDHEKLDVYQLELRFIAWVHELIEEIRRRASMQTREVRGQLDRGSLSFLPNTAEGNGKRQRQLRARFFDDARGSAMECAACLDALVAKRICTPSRIRDGKQMLGRIVQMLTKMVDRFDDTVVREPEGDYDPYPAPWADAGWPIADAGAESREDPAGPA